jgi:transposase-like protein
VVSELVTPRSGVDYPSTFPQLLEWFPDDESCRRYLEGLRWPEGFICPVCGTGDGWRIATGHWMCRRCGRKTSVTAGTIFHRSRLPLTSWFAACWFVCSQKNGVSALGLQRVMGFGSYQTAWAWMHKLRRAMVRPGRDLLSGMVEVDETFLGAKEKGTHGRGTTNKAVVVIAVELLEDPRRLGRVRMAHLPLVSAETLVGFVEDTVTKGSVVRTDGWNVYQRLGDHGFQHQPVNLVGSGKRAHQLLPGVHRVAALLKRWLAGTLHHGINHSHLDYYLDEFTFRFNRRTSRSRGLLFHRLLGQAVQTEPHPYKSLISTEGDLTWPIRQRLHPSR